MHLELKDSVPYRRPTVSPDTGKALPVCSVQAENIRIIFGLFLKIMRM
jgi:hypothetical protein